MEEITKMKQQLKNSYTNRNSFADNYDFPNVFTCANGQNECHHNNKSSSQVEGASNADDTFTNGDPEEGPNLSFDCLSCQSEDVDSEVSKGELQPQTSSTESDLGDASDLELDLCNRRKMHGNRSMSIGLLEWQDEMHNNDLIHRLNVFRRSRQFCDLIIQVGNRELHCHRVVLGAASRAIFNELCEGEQENGSVARIPLHSAPQSWVADAVEIIIEYLYTSKLSIPANLVTAVYKACRQLGIERVTPVCSRHIVANLVVGESVQIRRLASNVGDVELKDVVDSFIEENFEAVLECNEFLALPRIKMEISQSVNCDDPTLLSTSIRDNTLCTNALLWIYDVIQQKGGQFLEELTEQVQRLPVDELHSINSSQASSAKLRKLSQDMERTRLGDAGIARTAPIFNTRLSRSSSMDSLTSSETEESVKRHSSVIEGEWKIIAAKQSADHVTALCCAGDVICTLTIHLPSPSNGELTNGNAEGSAQHSSNSGWSSTSNSCSSSVGSVSYLCQLNQARCAAGVSAIGGKLYAAGGYNQSECLDTVECFDPTANRWTVVSRMNEKRGRFSVGVLRGQLYAVGGSSGSQNHASVERYDPASDSWSQVQQLLFRCSESGVAVLNDRLYCLGGVQQCSGVVGMKHCQVYDPDTDTWECRASMQTGRSTLGASSLGSYLYVAGGSDGWTCLSSSERYDPAADHWTPIANLIVPRRGLGMTSHNGALYCAGGFDGQSFLSSIERYSPSDGDVWCHVTATLTLPRNQVGLASVNGSLFVVGGFSGRHFLNSVELLDESNAEWTNQDQSCSVGVAPVSEPETSS